MRALLSTRPRRAAALVLVLFLVAGTAWAVWQALAPVSGQVTTAEAPKVTWSTSTPTVVSGSCSPSVSAGTLSLSLADAVPGSACTVEATLTLENGSGAATVQSLDLVPEATTWSEGVELQTALVQGCGVTLSSSGTPSTKVRISVEVLDGAAPGQAYPLEGGVLAVPPSMYDAAAC